MRRRRRRRAAPPRWPSLPRTSRIDKKTLEVAANQPFVIDFKNDDPLGRDPRRRSAPERRHGDQEPGPDPRRHRGRYQYDGLPPGTYTYICSIHPIPAMTGTLTVK